VLLFHIDRTFCIQFITQIAQISVYIIWQNNNGLKRILLTASLLIQFKTKEDLYREIGEK